MIPMKNAERGELDWPSGSMCRQFFLMLSSRKAWSLPTWAGSAWISLQLTSCRGRQWGAAGIKQALKKYIKKWDFPHMKHFLTSSIRSLALPISSGMDTSLLLLTRRTLRGRLNKYFGNTDSRFRLWREIKRWPTLQQHVGSLGIDFQQK